MATFCDCEENQEELHRDVTWEEFMSLSEGERNDGRIWFITDKETKVDLIEELLLEVRKVREILEGSV